MSSTDPQLYAIFSAFVEELLGLRYDDHSRELLMDKLEVASTEAGFASLLDYYYFLRYSDDREPALQDLIEQLVVAETYFFRELPALRFLVEDVIIPKVQAGLQPRIWCSACATGEEPLTLAMLLDAANALDATSIVATDISRKNLARARNGRFRQRSVRDAAMPELVSRYLRRDGNEMVIERRLVDAVTFSQANLHDPPSFSKLGLFDAIVCRNVLIYFSEAGIRRVVGSLRDRLLADGVLLVGVSETLFRVDAGLTCEERRGIFYYRRAK